LRAGDGETQAHAVLGLHEFDDGAHTQGAISDLRIHDRSLRRLNFVEIDLAMRLGKFCVQLFESSIVLHSAFIKLLLDTSLTNCLVGDIVQLCDEQVVDLLV